MYGIKLPVRAVYPWDRLEFVDAEGQPVAPEDIAAALNAAPKRAFGTLTVAALSQMLDSIVEEFGEWPSEGSTDDQIAWRAKADAAFLSRLQAFAVPVISEVRTEARRAAFEEAAQLAEACDSPFSSATHEQDEACDLMARRIAATILDRIDRPAPATVGSILGGDDSDCGNG